MRENVVKNKSFAFAVRVVRLYQFLCNDKKEFILSKQLMRSGTSVGAMVRGLNMQRRKLILGTKWVLLKRKSTKASIGWNY